MMWLPIILVGLTVFMVVWLVQMSMQGTERTALERRERVELDGLRTLVDDLRETAWDHRELDSALAPIILEKIRAFERGNRGRAY